MFINTGVRPCDSNFDSAHGSATCMARLVVKFTAARGVALGYTNELRLTHRPSFVGT